MKVALRVFFILLSVVYPFLIYWGIEHQQHQLLVFLLSAILLVKSWISDTWAERIGMLLVALMIVGTMISADVKVGLLLYPVLINLTLLFVFASSLVRGMPVIERLARIREPSLPSEAITYTRRVTQAWCLFFIINASISLLTILWANPQLWLLYNGVIAYLLMGCMFLGEWLIRQRVRISSR